LRILVLVYVQGMRTSGEEAVFGEYGYCVDQQYRDWKGTPVSFECASIESHEVLP
jgi:hypothetical protein